MPGAGRQVHVRSVVSVAKSGASSPRVVSSMASTMSAAIAVTVTSTDGRLRHSQSTKRSAPTIGAPDQRPMLVSSRTTGTMRTAPRSTAAPSEGSASSSRSGAQRCSRPSMIRTVKGAAGAETGFVVVTDMLPVS